MLALVGVFVCAHATALATLPDPTGERDDAVVDLSTQTAALDVDIAPRDGLLTLLPKAQLSPTQGPTVSLAQADVAPPAPSITAPSSTDGLPRARGIAGESRVFWYATGASALASLGLRVVAFVPGLIAALTIGSMSFAFGPAVPMILFVALATGFAGVDAAVGALAGSLVFDRASSFYDSRYVAAFTGQFLGNALAVGVGSLLFGYGMMLITGVTMLTEFTGPSVLIGLTFFSFFGFLPASVVAFFASIALPSLVGAWALANTATPRAGYRIDPSWSPFAVVDERAPARRTSARESKDGLSPLAFVFPTPLALR